LPAKGISKDPAAPAAARDVKIAPLLVITIAVRLKQGNMILQVILAIFGQALHRQPDSFLLDDKY
jgi:hypothetical protein